MKNYVNSSIVSAAKNGERLKAKRDFISIYHRSLRKNETSRNGITDRYKCALEMWKIAGTPPGHKGTEGEEGETNCRTWCKIIWDSLLLLAWLCGNDVPSDLHVVASFVARRTSSNATHHKRRAAAPILYFQFSPIASAASTRIEATKASRRLSNIWFNAENNWNEAESRN